MGGSNICGICGIWQYAVPFHASHGFNGLLLEALCFRGVSIVTPRMLHAPRHLAGFVKIAQEASSLGAGCEHQAHHFCNYRVPLLPPIPPQGTQVRRRKPHPNCPRDRNSMDADIGFYHALRCSFFPGESKGQRAGIRDFLGLLYTCLCSLYTSPRAADRFLIPIVAIPFSRDILHISAATTGYQPRFDFRLHIQLPALVTTSPKIAPAQHLATNAIFTCVTIAGLCNFTRCFEDRSLPDISCDD